MSRKLPRDLLLDLLVELDDLSDFVGDDIDRIAKDKRTYKAVIRTYEVIGEIVKRLPEDYKESHPEIPWRLLARFRDLLAHHYDDLVIANVQIALRDVPALRGAVKDFWTCCRVTQRIRCRTTPQNHLFDLCKM